MCILNLQCSVRYNLAYVTSTLQLPQQFSLLSWHLSLLMPPWAFPSFFQAHQFHHDPLFFEQSHLSAMQEKKKRLFAFTFKPCQNTTWSLFTFEVQVDKGSLVNILKVKTFSSVLEWTTMCLCIFSLYFFFPIFWPKFPWEISLEFFYYSDMKCLTPVKKTCFDGNAFSWNSSKTSTLIAADF